jgi:hypothetical protein
MYAAVERGKWIYIQLFHVSQLKQRVPDHTPVFTELPSTLKDFPEEILDHRLVKITRRRS